MKHGWLAGVVIGAILAASAWLLRGQAETTQVGDAKEKRTISTTGTATVLVKPDSARVFFGIESLAKSLKEARADNNKRVKAAVDALQALKIPNMRMKTSDVTVSLEKTHHKTGELTEIIGYRVTNTFTVVVQNDDVDKLGTLARLVLDTALENGANIVEHISFFKREVGQFRREALAKAVEDATANAKALAGGAKVELREPVTIHGQPEYHLGRYNMDNRQQALAPGGGGDEAPMVAGNLTITCKVSVSYTY